MASPVEDLPFDTKTSGLMSSKIAVKNFPELRGLQVRLVVNEDEDLLLLEYCFGCRYVLPLLYKVSGGRFLCERCLKYEQEPIDGKTRNPLKWQVEWKDIEFLTGDCPNNGCRELVALGNIREHLGRCPVSVGGDSLIRSELDHVGIAHETKGTKVSKKKQKGNAGVNVPEEGEDEIGALKKMIVELSSRLSALEQEQRKQRCLVSAALKRPPFSYTWCIDSFKKFKEEALKRSEGCFSEPFFFGIPGCKFRLQSSLVHLETITYLGVFVQFKVTDQGRFQEVDHPKMKCTVEITSGHKSADNLVFHFVFSADGSDERRTPGRAKYMWNTLFGRPKFVTLTTLEDRSFGYIQDDVLLIEFHVRD